MSAGRVLNYIFSYPTSRDLLGVGLFLFSKQGARVVLSGNTFPLLAGIEDDYFNVRKSLWLVT